jgi:hypothetical protein
MVFAAGETAYYRGEPGKPLELIQPHAPGWPTLPGQPRVLTEMPGTEWPLIGLTVGLAAPGFTGDYHIHYLPAGERYRPAADVWSVMWWGTWPLSGTATGINRILAGEFPPMPPAPRAAVPEAPRHAVFARPIAGGDGNPFIDATYRYGSTMGGAFQQHQGVEFNNPPGTPVRAVADGVVVFAGKAEQGANTVAIRHDQRQDAQYIFSAYYHNSTLTVRAGQRVRAGEVIARVGNTGRATNNHLHLEIHVSPQPDSAQIVNANERFPPHTVNPQLWIEPMPGTGIVAAAWSMRRVSWYRAHAYTDSCRRIRRRRHSRSWKRTGTARTLTRSTTRTSRLVTLPRVSTCWAPTSTGGASGAGSQCNRGA